MGRLFLDFDSTLVDSSCVLLSTYHLFDRSLPVKPTQTYCLKWNASDVIPHARKDIIHAIFDSDIFFDKLELFDGVYETLNKIHSTGHDLYIVSLGTPNNCKKKMDWIASNLPFCTFVPIVQNGKHVFDKSIINMNRQNDVYLDDRVDCLNSVDCSNKILYKHNNLPYEWAEGWNGLIATQWDESFKNNLLELLK